MFRHGVALFAVTMSACASAPESPLSAPESWKDCHCDWLEQETRAIAGPLAPGVECDIVRPADGELPTTCRSRRR
jgi:hypothetical protein